jgi:RNA polymerase sigma factor (sigma-70 family)
LLYQLQSVLGAGKGSKLLDGELLEQFTSERDQTAFATLVRRHGPMVLSVCRRMLHNAADADDAFQATFLILARKAASIGKRQALAAWLHQVAYRVALRTRAAAAQRRKHEEKPTGRLGDDPLAAITGRELLTVLDEELQALPVPSRGPLILCYLEERTRDEAARQLGLTLATLKRRLERGRAQLRRRLERRGLALAATLLTLDCLRTTARAGFSNLLAASTTRAAVQSAAGNGLAEVASTQIAGLVNGTLRAMALGKAMVASTLLLTVTLVGMGIGFAAYLGQDAPRGGEHEQRSPASPAPRGPEQAEEKKPAKPAEDLPPGARARFGTARFLNIGRVFAVTYSPDGRLLASGAWDGSIRLWKAATGKELLVLDAHKGPVQKLAFSPDGKLLASAGQGPGVALWEIPSGRLVRVMRPEQQGFTDVAFSPDGRKLAGIGGGIIYVWDQSGKELWKDGSDHAIGHRAYTHCAFCGPDSIASSFTLWKSKTPFIRQTFLCRRSFRNEKELYLQQLLPENQYGVSASFAPDGKIVAFRTDWNNREGVVSYVLPEQAKSNQVIRVPGQHISALCVSPDRRMLALTGDPWEEGAPGKRIRIYEVCTGQERCRFECREDKGELSLAFSPDCRTLAMGSLDVTVLLWDLTGPPPKSGAGAPLTAGELDELWNHLKNRNGEQAYRSLWKLVRAPRQATAYLAKRLRPAPRLDLKHVDDLIRDLRDSRFIVRQRATTELAKFEDLAVPALKEALKAISDLEVRRRIEKLLDATEQLSPEKLREIRAVEMLERIDTREAADLLRELAGGGPSARLTREAAEACQRLQARR